MKLSSPPISTVLLVEDDVILRLGLAEYLRSCGYRVIEAASLNEAQLVLEKGPAVHVLLADAQLEGPDREDRGAGFALSAWVKRNRPDITVVLTGGLASKTDAAAKLCQERDGAPYDVGELKQRIEGMRARQRRAGAVKAKRSGRAIAQRSGAKRAGS
jgi:CheY-like chemotaxis protein